MISHVRSDDESEDGTQDRHICCDSRKVVNVSLSRPPVGSGATRGARPLPRLGCFACKHLTWIFRSLVSPASAISPVEAELRAEHNHFFVLSPAHRPVWPGSACPRLASAGSGSSLSVSFSSQSPLRVKFSLRAGPEPSPEDQDQDWRLSRH